MAPTISTSPATHQLQVRRTFTASPERLFKAWTTAAELKRWHAPGPLNCSLAEVDLRVGGRYRIHMKAPDGSEHRVGGTYRVIDPPRKLSYTWTWETGKSADELLETLVTLEFLPKGTGTELVLTHEGFTVETTKGSHEQGWTAILEKLAAEK